MSVKLLNDKKTPYCPGCGHNSINHLIDKAIEKLDLDPLDIAVVSDIGCCGLIDSQLVCHTIHGLHGRSSALAAGISLGLNDPSKKVIAVMGDGGATIGLQHILEAARKNVDLTVLVLNNMVYGMTGGQFSGLSPLRFIETKLHETDASEPYDICALANQAGASFTSRVYVGQNLKEVLQGAIQNRGFSLVEVVDMCPSYGIPKVKDLVQTVGKEEITMTRDREVAKLPQRAAVSLFEKIPAFKPSFSSPLAERMEIIIAGSAGEGIQSAADLLAAAGILSGLKTTKKGEYPITVGTGFSVAEIICSRNDINYTGIEAPDIIFILSEDGMQKVKHFLNDKSQLIVDNHLEVPSGTKAVKGDFKDLAGKKGAALLAIAHWLNISEIIPKKALIEAAKLSKHAELFLEIIEKSNQPVKK